MPLSAKERSLRAQIAGLICAAKHSPSEMTAPMRAAAFARFEREADPDGTLTPEERDRRARLLQRAHLLRIGIKARKARARKARARAAGKERRRAQLGSLPVGEERQMQHAARRGGGGVVPLAPAAGGE